MNFCIRTVGFAAVFCIFSCFAFPVAGGVQSPSVFNRKAETSPLKILGRISAIEKLEEAEGVEKRLVTFDVDRSFGSQSAGLKVIAMCWTVTGTKNKMIGERLFFDPKQGKTVFATVDKDGEITSMTPAGARLIDAFEKTPDKIRYSVGAAYVDDGADQACEKSEDAFIRKDYKTAMVEINKAIATAPAYTEALVMRGRIYLAIGRAGDAERDFSRANQLEKDNMDSLYYRGIGRTNSKRFSEAVDDFNAVLKANPNDIKALYCRAFAYKLSGNSAKALADYGEILSKDKNNPLVIRQIALIQYEDGSQKSLEAAAANFELILKLNPNDMYSILFLRISNALSGKNDNSGLADFISKHGNAVEWPMPVLKMFAGSMTPEECVAAAAEGDKADSLKFRVCGTYYFSGMKRLIDGDRKSAAADFRKAVEFADPQALEFLLAKKELERLSASK